MRFFGDGLDPSSLCGCLVAEYHFRHHHRRPLCTDEQAINSMTILFRYILREYSKIFGMCFSGLVTIYLVIDFFEKVRRFLRYESGIVPILTYFALKIPSISFQVAPFAILVATLLTLGLFARSNEITAMRSCGISLLWMTSPFLLFATGVSMILFLFSSTVIPLASEKAEEVRAVQIEQRPAPVTVKATQPWAVSAPTA
jgi:lipopolysaccharide export system permease protein